MVIGTEFFKIVTLVDMPPHHLAFKVGVLVILLRNLDAAFELCNGTCLIIWCLAWRLIITRIIGGTHAGDIVNISHITLTTNYSKWPFTLQRPLFLLIMYSQKNVLKIESAKVKYF
jgi:hypothetical protein